MKRMIFAILLGCFFVYNCVFAEEEGTWYEPKRATFELGVGLWMSSFNFETEDGDLGVPGEIDYRKDLGFDDKIKPTFYFLWHNTPSQKLVLAYTPLSNSATKTLDSGKVFQDANFVQGDRVATDFNLNLVTLAWAWHLLDHDFSEVNVKLGPLVQLDLFITSIEMKAKNRAEKDSSPTIPVPFPSLGASFETTIYKYANVFCDVSGIYLGDTAEYLQFNTGVRGYPVHYLGVEFGYRYVKAKSVWDGDSMDSKFDGIHFSLLLRY